MSYTETLYSLKDIEIHLHGNQYWQTNYCFHLTARLSLTPVSPPMGTLMKAVLQFANVVVVPVFAGKTIAMVMKTTLQLILFLMILVLVTKLLAMMMLIILLLTCEHFKRFCRASACPVADRTEICQMNHDDYIINGVKQYCNTVIYS